MLQSWYEFDTSQLDKGQEMYIEFIQTTFNMSDQLKQPIKYEMAPHQIEYHSESLNILMEDAKHILWTKARGVSFTYSSLIELIITAASLKDQVIPVISQREQGAVDIVGEAEWLIENCNSDKLKNQFEFKRGVITNKLTGSKIMAFPSSSAADSIRSYRCIRGLIDEFAFQQRGEELWKAARETAQGELGQWIIGSTPNGRQNKFYDLVDRARKKGTQIGFKLMELPVFNPEKFDPDTPIHEQDLTPIAPWISMSRLEEKRAESKEGFLQENMNDFLDDFSSLISFTSVSARVRSSLVNHRDKYIKDPTYTYETDNPVLIGVDVALSGDLFAVAAFEVMTDSNGRKKYVQRWLSYRNFTEYPEAEEFMNNVIGVFPSTKEVRIDQNGLGEALPGYLKKTWGSIIKGVKGSQNIIVDKTDTVKAKTLMCTNLKRVIENDDVFLLDDKLQTTHITNIDKQFKAVRNSSEGHSDIFFACALALLPSTTSFSKSEYYSASSKDSINKTKRKNWSDMDPLERAKYLRKHN